MTFEQLRIFLAVAEREHLTRAAEVLHLTPSAVSASIRALELSYGVALFNRVGRRIELSDAGRLFLPEARAILVRVGTAEALIADLGGLKRGRLALQASQTIASHFLPPLMVAFQAAHPGVALSLVIGNTETVADAVAGGEAELGFVEGRIASPLLDSRKVAEDRLIVVVPPGHPWADGAPLSVAALGTSRWVLRESGSGTRSSFAEALLAAGLAVDDLDVALELPSNEAVLSAVASAPLATVVSEAAASAMIAAGRLVRVDCALPPRAFLMLRHKERHQTTAALAFADLAVTGISPPAPPPPRSRRGIPGA
ncbi:DNA-binding transcriptional regulator, LysR family [Kaistia soli DSM 19436]|uniref:DNA-binding transcriptional regulator, LysR family n=1 Tax=Kaistia soli DSM 19436 TaxID=1122133 RepID=A0A1M5JAK5_9HYPH|nr:LysR substrate-binding domain-containing protein [Kaistia soli]SHG37415.1 DNA-binding transcriptional regulator, LysR family [Kaistia soli DSM 19436]